MLSKKQLEIVEAQEKYVVVNSSAASGKTNTLVERVKYLLSLGVDPSKIVIITFTNAASEELFNRIGQVKGLHCSTVHSYANYLLMCGNIETKQLLDDERFNELFNKIKQHKECIQEVDYLLLDEGQDSTMEQFEFMLDMVNPKSWMIFADTKQSIYRWNNAYPDYIFQLQNRRDVKVYHLNENYRNGHKILDYAKGIIRLAGYDYFDDSIAMREEPGRVIDVEYSPGAIASTIKKMGSYGDWFILTRTNDQLDAFCTYLDKEGIPYDTFKRAQLDSAELNKKMHEDTVKVLTIHTAKGLEAKNVVVIGAKMYNVEEKCISYVAATRAIDLLVWARIPNAVKKRVANWES